MLVAIGALLRLFVIFAAGPDLFSREGLPEFEEILRGIAAQELIDGPILPVQDYQVNAFWGGSLVVSMLAVPSFLLLGSNLVALRLIPAALHLVSIACAFLIADRFVGRRAGWVAGLLMALPPAGYTFVSASVWSLHTESNTVALLMLYVYLEHRAAPGRRGLAALYGFLVGFGVYFSYELLIPVGLIIGLELARDRFFFLRRTFVAPAIGVLVGLLPWFRYQLLHKAPGVRVYGEPLYTHAAPTRVLSSVRDLLSLDLPQSLWFPDSLDGAWTGRLVSAVLIGFAIAAGWMLREPIRSFFGGLLKRQPQSKVPHPVLIALGFLALFGAAYIATRFMPGERKRPQNYRYLVPFYPFFAIAIACVFQELKTARVRRLVGATVGLLCAGFLTATLVRCDVSRFGDDWDTPATSNEAFVRFIVRRYRNDHEALEYVVAQIEAKRPPEVQDELLFGLACGYRHFTGEWQKRWKRRQKARDTLAFLQERVAEPYKPYFEMREGDRLYLPGEQAAFRRDRGLPPLPHEAP